MKYIVGHTANEAGVFAIDGDTAVNLSPLSSAIGGDLMGLIRQPDLADRLADAIAAAPRVPLAEITPALPVARPGTIICLGLNYVDHIKEGGYDIPEYPTLFMRGIKSMIPAGAPIVRPRVSEQLDYEAELMVIIGTGGRHIAEDAALDHVFGYTTFNDASIRNYQRKTHQWTPGKNFDNTGAVGPITVTPDALPKGAEGLRIQSRVGSEILQDATTSDMMWSVARTISLVSEYTTLEPGDFLAMGTPPGVGHARNPQRWLVPGETVEVEIEGIGICANPVVDET